MTKERRMMQLTHFRHLNPGKLVAASIACGLVWEGSVAHAVDYSWTPAVGGNFLDDANWSPAGGPPGAGDTAIFDSAATGTITLGANHTVNVLSFRNDSGSLTLDLGGNTLNLAAANGF